MIIPESLKIEVILTAFTLTFLEHLTQVPYEHIILTEKSQRQATKIISVIQNKAYEERMKHLKLPSVYRRMKYVMEMYKYTHEMLPLIKICSCSLWLSVCAEAHMCQ